MEIYSFPMKARDIIFAASLALTPQLAQPTPAPYQIVANQAQQRTENCLNANGDLVCELI